MMKYRGFFNFSSIFDDLDGSGSFLDAVLTRSRYAIGIFRVRFFVEIRDFEHFSWTQVQDFSKNEQFFERSRHVFAIFHVFSILERILARSRCIFRISLMKFRGIFNFS